jgi:LSD1 subclass zinc finger protein
MELLECSVCFECYAPPPSQNAPVSLSCGHSVCMQCAEGLQTAALRCRKGRGPLRIACPSCRKQLDLPPGGVKSLPCNYGLAQAAEAVELAARERSQHSRAAAAAPAPAPASAEKAAAAAAAPASPAATAAAKPMPARVTALEQMWGVGAAGAGAAGSGFATRIQVLEELLVGQHQVGTLLARVEALEQLSGGV